MAKTLEPGVHIYTPFLELTKEEVIEQGCILGVVLISDLKPALNLIRTCGERARRPQTHAPAMRKMNAI